MKITSLSKECKKPLVSIVCLTYNQEKYIAQCVEGFLAQRTDFCFEIIIHDDASTDGTLAIIKEYQAHYPELITIIEQSNNVYSKGVRVPALVIAQARGQFIAYCEGDDFWCDPSKIQRQANFLLNNPQVGVVFTNKDVFYQESGKLVRGSKMRSAKRVPSGAVKAALLLSNPYTTCTSMFRVEAVSGFEVIAKKLRARMDDYVMWLFIANKYEIEYWNEVTATYRILKHSASHSPRLELALLFLKSTYKTVTYFNFEYGHLVKKEQLKNQYRKLALDYCLSNGYYKKSLHYAKSTQEYAVAVLRVLIRKIIR